MDHLSKASKFKSRKSSYSSLDPVIEFNDFLETLSPEVRETYRAEHYAMQEYDEEITKNMWRRKSKPPKKLLAEAHLTSHAQSSHGIPSQYEEFLALPYKWYKLLRGMFLISGNPVIQPGIVRDAFGLQHERFLHLVSFPFTIHPYSNFYWVWNLLISALLASSLVYEPYLIAFKWTDMWANANATFSLAVSIMLLLDAFLSFRVGHKDSVTTKVSLDPLIIRRGYLTAKFWYNLLTRFPYDTVMLWFTTVDQRANKIEMTWIRLWTFSMKIMRFEKLHWFLHELTISLNMKTWTTQVAMHGMLALFCFHWGACLHWLLPDVVNAHYFKEFSEYKKHSWVTQLDLWDKESWFQYLNSLLRSLGNILCLDGGLYAPREYEEILASSILICLSVSNVAYFISTFTTMIVEAQRGDNRHLEMMRCVQEYMRFRKTPIWLRERVLAYFDGKYRGKCFPESQLFLNISENLKNEILQHNCKQMLENVYIFADVPKSAVKNLVHRLEYEVYVPGDVLLGPNIRRDCIFFIEEGYFGVMNEFGSRVQLLEHGNFFGEVDLLCPLIPRRTSIIALSISTVYKLSKTEYMTCMELYPQIHEKGKHFLNLQFTVFH